jgi:hypothetical protein
MEEKEDNIGLRLNTLFFLSDITFIIIITIISKCKICI